MLTLTREDHIMWLYGPAGNIRRVYYKLMINKLVHVGVLGDDIHSLKQREPEEYALWSASTDIFMFDGVGKKDHAGIEACFRLLLLTWGMLK